MATVQVLCPNGRRQNVKITPNSKLLQVLEEVCQKQGFLPPEDYNLISGRKTLDLTLSFRYSGLVNNSKLELVKCATSRAEEDVLIALQLEDGSRHQHPFKPSITLWDILLFWENQPNSVHKDKLTMIDTSQTPVKHPVCIYMREEVIGEVALKNTTLKKLALTGGKAVIRMVHRAVDDMALAKIIHSVEVDHVKRAKLEEIATQKFLEQSKDCVTPNPQSSSQVSCDSQEPMEIDSGESSDQTSSSRMNTDRSNTSQTAEISFDANPRDTNLRDDNQIEISSGSNQPDSTVSSASNENSINRLREMNIPGVEIFTPQDFANLSRGEQAIATRLAQAFLPGLMRNSNTQNQSVARPRQQPVQPNFTDFKFPEETKGKEVYKNELSAVNREEFKPCDRETILYSIEETLITSKAASQELSDEFFEVNENDLRILMEDSHKKVESLDSQLMTKSMRLAALESKYEMYDKVVIRVQFPNKLVLQAIFRPRETVFALYKYVKDILEDKNMKFYLYTSPPRNILKDRSLTLLEANMVPATLVYFGTESQHDSYVSPELISSISPRVKAEEIVSKCLKSDELSAAASSLDNKSLKSSRSSTKSSDVTSSTSGEKKVPKWLKLCNEYLINSIFFNPNANAL